jgi:16S rRNA (uracil1498-N3)-methyltransferase
MPGYNFRTSRLFVDAPLRAAATVGLGRAQAHYLTNVLRLKAGDGILIFNGRDGEWSATIEGGKHATLRVGLPTRPQTNAADLHYLFAPPKSARLDYVVQKAVELGVSRLQPVITRHGQVARINLERMRGNSIEAAQQCGILSLPDIGIPIALPRLIAERDPARWLVFCDEDAEVANPAAALELIAPGSPLAVLIGAEGGFAKDERTLLLRQRNVVRLALGPRILRADTAAVAALALVQTMLGDWR